jgi:hypothetical protein
MRRAVLVTTEMRQLALFNAAIPQIEAAIRRGSIRGATRRIKTLMNELIQQPSEQTVEIFIEMRRRWNFLVDTFEFLENHWQEWATWQDRLEIIWHKFGTRSAESELIHAVYLFFEQINPENCGLGAKEYLRRVIRMVVGFEQNVRLRSQLIQLFESRYGGVIRVHRYVSNLMDARVSASTSLPTDQMRNFWRQNSH